MNGHLVTVKVGVVGFTDQWVQANCPTFNQGWFEGLNPQTVERRCPVEKHWVFLDNFFNYWPDGSILSFNHALSILNVASNATFHQFFHNERLEEFDGHFFWQTTLVHLEVWPHDNYRTTRVVDPFP